MPQVFVNTSGGGQFAQPLTGFHEHFFQAYISPNAPDEVFQELLPNHWTKR